MVRHQRLRAAAYPGGNWHKPSFSSSWRGGRYLPKTRLCKHFVTWWWNGKTFPWGFVLDREGGGARFGKHPVLRFPPPNVPCVERPNPRVSLWGRSVFFSDA